MFFAPIEAKYVRIKPRSWRNNIAIRVALLGCPVTSTTTGYELHSTNQPTIKCNLHFINKTIGKNV